MKIDKLLDLQCPKFSFIAKKECRRDSKERMESTITGLCYEQKRMISHLHIRTNINIYTLKIICKAVDTISKSQSTGRETEADRTLKIIRILL